MVHGLVREAEQASFSPLVFSTTGGREGRNQCFTVMWLTVYLAAALPVLVRLWLLFNALYHFLYSVQLQYASVEAHSFRITLPMPSQRWAASTETIRATMCFFTCPACTIFSWGWQARAVHLDRGKIISIATSILAYAGCSNFNISYSMNKIGYCVPYQPPTVATTLRCQLFSIIN